MHSVSLEQPFSDDLFSKPVDFNVFSDEPDTGLFVVPGKEECFLL